MRTPKKQINRNRISFVRSVSSPVGGLNARDPVASMKPTDAIKLDNFFCNPFNTVVRKGYSNQATGFSTPVNTLASYSRLTTSGSTLFAYSGTSIYDITTPGAIGTPVIDGLANSTFQTCSFGTSGGVFLISVNGTDLPLIYNGTVWTNVQAAAFSATVVSLTSVGTVATLTLSAPHNWKTGMSVTIAGFTPAGYNGTFAITVTGANTLTYVLPAPVGAVTVSGTAAPALSFVVTGVDPASFIQVIAFKTRFWAVQKDSTKAWYMPAVSIGGVAAAIDLAPFFTLGGYLMAMANWSLDAGQGMDDYIAFMSSEGQVVVYKGTDPASSSTFSMVGVFDIAPPIGRRCFTKYGGDVLAITQDGLVPLSEALMSTRVTTKVAVTNKIQSKISADVTSYNTLFGWTSVIVPRENMLILNVPTSNTTSIQYAMNTISKAWSSFSGWNAHCWVINDDIPYFGGETFVAKAWDGYTDDGASISFGAQQSFSYFSDSVSLKHVRMVRPVIATDGSPALLFGVNVDFDTTTPTGVPSFTPTTGGIWDAGLWDVSLWGGEPTIKKDWQTVSVLGYCVSAHIVGSVLGARLQWSSTDYLMVEGGLI